MDWDKIATLLHIVDKSAGHPQLKNITNDALAELKKHNDGEYERSTEVRRGPIKPIPGEA